MMHSFISSSQDVFWNLSLEEFLIKKKTEDFFFLWRSEPAVVIGKHQNPYKEIQLSELLKHPISVARRISGGGTVYHDLGNINFTFIKNTEQGKQVDFKKHSKPIFEALSNLEFPISYSDRNDMRIDGKKFSGNAEHVYKNRVLHHGTLLFDTDLERLNTVLADKRFRYKDTSVDSFRSIVTNLKEYTRKIKSEEQFINLLFSNITDDKERFKLYELSQDEEQEVLKLQSGKYTTEDWIWGYTPKYSFSANLMFQGENISMDIEVRKGIIKEIQFHDTGTTMQDFFRNLFLGQKHTLINIERLLKDYHFSKEQILSMFF